MAADEAAAKVDVLEIVLFRLQVGDLADVVAVEGRVSEVSGLVSDGWNLPDCVE